MTHLFTKKSNYECVKCMSIIGLFILGTGYKNVIRTI